MPVILGKSGVNRECKEIYLGNSGINKKEKELYLGNSGVNKQVYENEINVPSIGISSSKIPSKVSTGAKAFNNASFVFKLTTWGAARNTAIAQFVLYLDSSLTKYIYFGKGRSYYYDDITESGEYFYIHRYGYFDGTSESYKSLAYSGQASGVTSNSAFTITKGSTGLDISILHAYDSSTKTGNILYSDLTLAGIDVTNVYGYGTSHTIDSTETVSGSILNLSVK